MGSGQSLADCTFFPHSPNPQQDLGHPGNAAQAWFSRPLTLDTQRATAIWVTVQGQGCPGGWQGGEMMDVVLVVGRPGGGSGSISLYGPREATGLAKTDSSDSGKHWEYHGGKGLAYN